MEIAKESVAEVLEDLLVLYLAGEASPGSQRLVESYAAENKQFAARLAKGREDVPGRLPAGQDRAMEVLTETRKFLRLQKILFGVGIFFCLLPFTILVRHGRIEFLLLRDAPAEAAGAFVIGVGAWVWYWILQRKMSAAGMSLRK